MTTEVINNDILVPTIAITANGSALTKDQLRDVIFSEVEQNLYVPSMAIIRLFHRDLATNYPTTFAIGTVVQVTMGQSSRDSGEVFNGEVVAQEIDASPTGIPTITIRAYDKRHRLMRGRKIKVYKNVKDSDNFPTVASAAGLSADATATDEVYPWIIQNNETDLEFLTRRALRIGMEVMMDGTTLKMRKPALTVDTVAVTWGQDLLDFKVRLNSSGQVNSVTVRGWDVATKAAIVGTSSSSTFNQTYGLGKDGAALSNDFGSSNVLYNVYRPVTTQAEANLVASAIHDDINGRAVQIQGRCFGNNAIKVGATLEIKKVGTDYNGKYYITSCTHRSDIENGYTTIFESNGKNTNSIIELTNQLNERGSGGMVGPIIGLVTNVNSEDDAKGQVKVKYPVLGDTIESDWVRLVSPMAGGKRGILFMPEVNDEVLVVFENGDISRPFVLGAVWNGKDAPPLTGSSNQADGKIKERTIQTVSGHKLTFNDTDDAPGITILDKTGKNKIFIDSTANKISIESDGDMLLKAKTKMTIEAADLDITITNKITQKGGQVDMQSTTSDFSIKATTDLKLEGGMNFAAKGAIGAKVEGVNLELKGSAMGKLDGGGITEIKGGLIKLN